MSEYISKKELRKIVDCKRNCEECDFYTQGDTWCDGKIYGTTIMQMKTIDIVFCAECKHRNGFNDQCEHSCWYGTAMKDNDFCSYGERKDKP